MGVLRISLFGSFARSESNFNDIDILVKLPDLKKRKRIGLKWFSIDQELSKKIGLTIDLVSEDSLNENLSQIIKKDLEVIYEKAR